MKIGMIDVDNYEHIGDCFPNLVLMKLSAWHKAHGDSVEWYEPLFSGHLDLVYMSKVFSFTPDYPFVIDADKIQRGGSGYCITIKNGVEVFDKSKDIELPYEIEHIMPDYSLYGITDTAYGFLSRGCPRGCGFCHVAKKEGKCAYKVADLSEFWNGQKEIKLYDPNILACKDWRDLLNQLIESKARVDINQGLDIRLINEEKAELIKKINIKYVHFAWDNYADKEIITEKLKLFKDITGWNRNRVTIYTLTNYGSSMEENIERVEFIKSLNFQPYVTIYNKESLPSQHVLRKYQRYVNNPFVFWSNDCKSFEEYQNK